MHVQRINFIKIRNICVRLADYQPACGIYARPRSELVKSLIGFTLINEITELSGKANNYMKLEYVLLDRFSSVIDILTFLLCYHVVE